MPSVNDEIVALKLVGGQVSVYQAVSACRCMHFTDCSAPHICSCGLWCGHRELAEVDYYA